MIQRPPGSGHHKLNISSSCMFRVSGLDLYQRHLNSCGVLETHVAYLTEAAQVHMAVKLTCPQHRGFIHAAEAERGAAAAAHVRALAKTRNQYKVINVSPHHYFFLFYTLTAPMEDKKSKELPSNHRFILT